jgi:hypothetical protein
MAKAPTLKMPIQPMDDLVTLLADSVSLPGDKFPRAPKQLRIMRKLSALLEATSGFEGIKCWRGKAVLTGKDTADTLSLLEAPRPIVGSPAAEQGVKRDETWTLLLQGWPVDDPAEPSAPAYWMKAACEQQLSLVIAELPNGVQRRDDVYMLGGDISSLTIGQGVVRPAGEEGASRLAMFYIPLIIGLQTDVRNPFA